MIRDEDDASAAIEASGVISGLVDLDAHVSWGQVKFAPHEDGIHFNVAIELARAHLDSAPARIAAAVEAAIAANCRTGVRAQVTEWGYAKGAVRRSASLTQISYDVRKSIEVDDLATDRGRHAFEATLLEPRLHDLYGLYTLGLRAVQTLGPVVGLWAFTTVLEEANPGRMDHVQDLADNLRDVGYAIESNPSRHPARIRAAALHPTPDDNPPTLDEVEWLGQVAGAYLADRARQIATI